MAVLDAQPNDAQDFSFTAGGGLSPTSFQLDDDSDPALSEHAHVQRPAGRRRLLARRDRRAGRLVTRRAPPVTTAARCRTSTSRRARSVTCTFTNQKRGEIVVVKDATPERPAGLRLHGRRRPLARAASSSTTTPTARSRTRARSPSVAPGAGYSVSETVPSGWDQTSATCDDGSPVSNIDVAPGETVTCTFTNRKRGQHRGREGRHARRPAGLRLHGRRRPLARELPARRRRRRRRSRTRAPSATSCRAAATRSPRPCRAAGTRPARPATTAARSRTSTSRPARPSPARSRTASAARSWSSRTPLPNDPQDFAFTAGGGLSPAELLSSTTTPTGRSRTRARSPTSCRAPATRSPRPCPPAGTRRAPPATTAARSRTSTLAAGETVTCTFTNRKRGPDRGRQGRDPERPAGLLVHGRRRPVARQLLARRRRRRDAVEHAHLRRRAARQRLLASPRRCPAAGTRPPRPATTAARFEHRRGAPARPSPARSRTASAGRSSWSQDAVPNDPQDFAFTAGGGLVTVELLARRRPRPGARRTRGRSTNVPAGSGYSVAETVPGGWDQTSATCDDGSPVSNINVSAGETVTCTFTNTKRGTIVVVKDAAPERRAGLRLHGRRRPLAGQLHPRRRLRRDALEHAHLPTSCPATATRCPRPCRAAGTRPIGDLRRRQPGVEHRRRARRDRHLHLHERASAAASWS